MKKWLFIFYVKNHFHDTSVRGVRSLKFFAPTPLLLRLNKL